MGTIIGPVLMAVLMVVNLLTKLSILVQDIRVNCIITVLNQSGLFMMEM